MSVKRKDIVRLLEANGFRLIREGGNHSVYSDGEKMVPVKRHNRFDESRQMSCANRLELANRSRDGA